ncbi:hypothetical protein [Chromobacterium sphagni]|uniref:Uncharacterized protein n=1 Tax=Chromobacterium sphagni TaxID=1903179 RepID=A0ABX3C977_9NEIS|nr:hypothetical protein [Chromobacterium sphagni]OHX18112.1 hypothetical protein BI344_11300 [Chromobacterium sphagni]
MKLRALLFPLLLVLAAALLLFQLNRSMAGIAATPPMIAVHLMLAALLLLPLWLNKAWLGRKLADAGWPALRAQGKVRFILIYGVLGRGVPLTLFVFGMSSVAQSKPALAMGPALLFWLLMGGVFASSQWRQLERANQTQDKQ